MFRQVLFQTGELREIVQEMKNGGIPCLEVTDLEDFNSFTLRLSSFNIVIADDIPYDKKARDSVKEPEFEFRAAFYSDCPEIPEIMYIDVYFEPEYERTYDPVGEM